MNMTNRVFMVLMALVATTVVSPGAGSRQLIHAVNSLSHYYDFFSDWGLAGQYLDEGQDKYQTSWCCLYNADLSNANLLFLLNCDDRLPYVPADFRKMEAFLLDGGGLMVLSHGQSVEQNKLAKQYGAEFIGGIEPPVKTKAPARGGTVAVKPYGGCHVVFDDPRRWTIVAEDAQGRAVLAYTRVKRGWLLLGSRALLADNPDRPDDVINRSLWHQVWHQVASGKRVSPARPFKREYIEALENNVRTNGLDIYFNDYLKPSANSMVSISSRCLPAIEAVMGVPRARGMASKIILVPTADGGYSSGEIIALAVWWGDFPEKEDSMIEFITHEAVHSWVLPFPEIWNEPMATYVGHLVMMNMGFREEAERRIEERIARAREYDPEFKVYDMQGRSANPRVANLGREKVADLQWGKAFWIFEQLRRQKPDFIAAYFKAKRKYALPGKIKQYDENHTVAVVSIAMGRDLFPWFQSLGFKVNKASAGIKCPK